MKLRIILILGKFIHLMKWELILTSVLLAVGLFIPVTINGYLLLWGCSSVVVLLLAKDENILYECDRKSGSAGILLTAYKLRHSIFTDKISKSVSEISVLRSVRPSLLRESIIVCCLLTASLLIRSDLHGFANRKHVSNSQLDRLAEILSDLEDSSKSVERKDLRNSLDELSDALKEYMQSGSNQSKVLMSVGNASSILSRESNSNLAGSDIQNLLGEISSIIHGQYLQYEIMLKAYKNRVYSDAPEDRVSIDLNLSGNMKLYDGGRMDKNIPLKYKIVLKSYLDGGK